MASPVAGFSPRAGGLAVSFVAIRLMPAVADSDARLRAAIEDGPLHFVDDPAWTLLLLSLFVFYGLERLARRSQAANRDAGSGEATRPGVFWLHMATFAAMNVLVGYLLLHNQERSGGALAAFFVAMLVKFVVNDHGLHSLHKARYDNLGRWLLAAAVVGGWGLRAVHRFSDAVPVALQAILAGAVLLNVLKEELPSERKSRYWAFLAAGLAYAGFLLAF